MQTCRRPDPRDPQATAVAWLPVPTPCRHLCTLPKERQRTLCGKRRDSVETQPLRTPACPVQKRGLPPRSLAVHACCAPCGFLCRGDTFSPQFCASSTLLPVALLRGSLCHPPPPFAVDPELRAGLGVPAAPWEVSTVTRVNWGASPLCTPGRGWVVEASLPRSVQVPQILCIRVSAPFSKAPEICPLVPGDSHISSVTTADTTT